MAEFQSHETAFDPLNSTQIPEKVNVVEWINMYNSRSPCLLSANDKLIKCWKIENKKEKKVESCKKLFEKTKGKLVMPRTKIINENMEGVCKSYYKGAHEFHINSLSLNSDGENFLSSDDLRINIWSLNDPTTVYNVLDVKPKSLTDIEEAITHSEFHPHLSHLFHYTTSKGYLNICDFREKAMFHSGASLKFEIGNVTKKNAFSDIINCVSKAKFLGNSEHTIATRDYLSVKLWDIRSTTQKYYQNIQVCDYLDKGLISLYEDDSIYDRFFLDVSPNSQYLLTGAYNKSAHVIDVNGATNVTIPVSFDAKRGKVIGKARKYGTNKKLMAMEGAGATDFKRKVQFGCWHPTENLMALAFRNCIFMCYEKNK